MGHGKTLVTIEKNEDQLNIYEKILSKSLSVRETEKLANKSKNPQKNLKPSKLKEPFITILKKLKKTYNAEVKITLNSKEKGSITIPFDNIKDFQKINKKLNEHK